MCGNFFCALSRSLCVCVCRVFDCWIFALHFNIHMNILICYLLFSLAWHLRTNIRFWHVCLQSMWISSTVIFACTWIHDEHWIQWFAIDFNVTLNWTEFQAHFKSYCSCSRLISYFELNCFLLINFFPASISTTFQSINSIVWWIPNNRLDNDNFAGNWNESIFHYILFFLIFCSFCCNFQQWTNNMFGCCRGTFQIFGKLFVKWKWIINLNWIPAVAFFITCLFVFFVSANSIKHSYPEEKHRFHVLIFHVMHTILFAFYCYWLIFFSKVAKLFELLLSLSFVLYFSD